MLDFTTYSECDAVIARAHQMRAAALTNMLRSVGALFRRKADAQPAKA